MPLLVCFPYYELHYFPIISYIFFKHSQKILQRHGGNGYLAWVFSSTEGKGRGITVITKTFTYLYSTVPSV